METFNLTDYDKIITALFTKKYKTTRKMDRVDFTKDELVEIAKKLKIPLRNPPDVVYTFRSRRVLPNTILRTGNWILTPRGKGKFSFTITYSNNNSEGRTN
jgi:hypothetical protein